jgi:hypothetical protein
MQNPSHIESCSHAHHLAALRSGARRSNSTALTAPPLALHVIDVDIQYRRMRVLLANRML